VLDQPARSEPTDLDVVGDLQADGLDDVEALTRT
jgi:hypothetical protein